MGQYCAKVARPTLKHFGTYGEQAGRHLLTLQRSVTWDGYSGQRAEDSEPESVSQFSRVSHHLCSRCRAFLDFSCVCLHDRPRCSVSVSPHARFLRSSASIESVDSCRSNRCASQQFTLVNSLNCFIDHDFAVGPFWLCKSLLDELRLAESVNSLKSLTDTSLTFIRFACDALSLHFYLFVYAAHVFPLI